MEDESGSEAEYRISECDQVKLTWNHLLSFAWQIADGMVRHFNFFTPTYFLSELFG